MLIIKRHSPNTLRNEEFVKILKNKLLQRNNLRCHTHLLTISFLSNKYSLTSTLEVENGQADKR